MTTTAHPDTCEHGLSASLCAGPFHYPDDSHDGPLASIADAAAQYHARGEACPFDCYRCDPPYEYDEDTDTYF